MSCTDFLVIERIWKKTGGLSVNPAECIQNALYVQENPLKVMYRHMWQIEGREASDASSLTRQTAGQSHGRLVRWIMAGEKHLENLSSSSRLHASFQVRRWLLTLPVVKRSTVLSTPIHKLRHKDKLFLKFVEKSAIINFHDLNGTLLTIGAGKLCPYPSSKWQYDLRMQAYLGLRLFCVRGHGTE